MDKVLEILIPAALIGLMGLVFGAIIAITGRIFAVKQDPKRDAVRELLPGANCGGCGFAGCDAYAQAVADGTAKPDLCPVGGDQVSREIGRIVGVEVEVHDKLVALVRCRGDIETCSLNFEYDGPKTCRAAALAAMGDKGCHYSCLGFGDCAAVCKFNAIVIEDGRLARIDPDKCTGCGVCASTCPRGVIRLVPRKRAVLSVCSALDRGQMVRENCNSGCIACGKCARECHFGAIKMKDNLPEIDYDKCMGCMQCADNCPTGALRANESLRRHAMIHYPKCTGCDVCTDVCHFDAIIGGEGRRHSVIEWNCVGCGWCEEVCPSGCVEMLPGGPYKKK